jgi:hypothetical protein
MDALNDTHRAFLQEMLEHSVISDVVVQKMYSLLSEKLLNRTDSDSNGYMEWINEMNRHLRCVDYELGCVVCPVRNEKTWALVNINGGDDVCKLGTAYGSIELEHIKGLIDMIVKAPNGSFCISMTDALNLSEGRKKDMEDLIFSLQKNSWLLQPERGKLTLGPKLLLELGGYLFDMYPDDIYECALCHGIVTIGGFTCHQKDCSCRLHGYCQDRYFGIQNDKSTKSCPSCKSPWKLIR